MFCIATTGFALCSLPFPTTSLIMLHVTIPRTFLLCALQVCADDKKTCCTTPPLKKTFSDDWSANDLEQWGPDYFGPCKGKKFLVRRGLDVTIEKDGKSALAVTSLFIEADGVTSDPKLR